MFLFICLFWAFKILIALEHLDSSTQFKETLMSVSLMFFKEILSIKLGVENLVFCSGFATNWLSNFGQVILTLWV